MMERADIYRDIAERTNGDVYVGVVGPVRTGKSTFIKRFMDLMVLPGITDEFELKRLTDELPQSGAGKTIMTTQPKFIPNEACAVTLAQSAQVRLRMVDCVGYMVKGALGFEENSAARMVKTPWSAEDMPFEQAAETGTRKVITDHSTIAVLVTTDGTITDIERDSYVQAEERVVGELKEQGVPFVILLNSRAPGQTVLLRDRLCEKYGAPVLAVDVLNMHAEDMTELFERVLFEFPVRQAIFEMPGWMKALGDEHWLMAELYAALGTRCGNVCKMRDYAEFFAAFDGAGSVTGVMLEEIRLGSGELVYRLNVDESLFYRILAEESGCEISSDFELMSIMKELMFAKREYDRFKNALNSARATGYGMIPPATGELTLAEPEVIKRGNQYGVRLKACGPSLHIFKADVVSEVSPVVGSEQQGEELVKYMLAGFENEPAKLWETNIFGKSLQELITEGVSAKLMRVPETIKHKLSTAMCRVINDGNGNMICILF